MTDVRQAAAEGVWADLVGQHHVVAEMRAAAQSASRAVAGHTAGGAVGMTHAWLVTGPPGSGRSRAALAFAAALECPQGGCGRCAVCHQVLTGEHVDVEVVSTDKLSVSTKEARELVTRAALAPSVAPWHVIVVEDADRMGERAVNVLLKSIEEPPERTVWLLCAPSLDDVLPTIRSRCRHVVLVTPSVEDVAEVLVRRDGVDPAMAAFAARAAQGHVGRARRLATDERVRLRRAEVLRLPLSLERVSDCVLAAAELHDAAKEDAADATAATAVSERAELSRTLGVEPGSARAPRWASAQFRELEEDQKKRATRALRDALDRALVDLVAFYRDVLAVQLGVQAPLVNDEMRPAVERLAAASSAAETLRRVDVVLAARDAIGRNVAPLLALEAMTLGLRPAGPGVDGNRGGRPAG